MDKAMVVKIGVMSDTHGHIENLSRALKSMREAGATIIIHLGDDYEDMKSFCPPPDTEIIQVPGVFSTYYRDPGIPNRLIKEWEGITALLTHTRGAHENDLPADLKPAEVAATGEVRLVLFGHTHIPEAEEDDGVIWVNPGHLKDEDKKGYPPTYALLEIAGKDVKARIVELFGGRELFVYP